MTSTSQTDILWLGSQFPDPDASADDASSPAAIAWQQGLLDALRDRVRKVTAIGHVPYQSWPSGRLKATLERPPGLATGDRGERTYPNVRGLRVPALARHYYRAARSVVADAGQPTAVLTYNAYPYLAIAAARLQRELSVPWINIDADRVRFHANPVVAGILRPAGTVHLSWNAFSTHHSPQKLHLDGGVHAVQPSPPDHPEGRHAVLFAGTLAGYTGLPMLLEAFCEVERLDVDLWICGKGDTATVIKAATGNPRIKYMGYVSDEELTNLARQACAFINPRPTDMAVNAGNFPSKILFYLTFGKPVISTSTGGLGPEYGRAITLADGASELGGCIDRVAEVCGSPEYVRWCSSVQELAAEKTWDVAAERLSEFVASVTRSSRR